MRVLRWMGVLVLVSAATSSCGRSAARPQPRLVVLYATCTLNKAYLGPYDRGEQVDYTPNLDAFAEEAVVFQRHQSESGQSGISFASIFSGTQADRHGVYDHPNPLSDELYLVTEAFRDAGYEPWFWSGHQMASADLGYGQGVPPERVFDGTRAPRKREKLWSFLQPENPLMQQLLAKLEADPEYRAFVLCNFTVTHGKYHRQVPDHAYDAFLAQHPGPAGGLTRDDLEDAWAIYDTKYVEDGKERQLRFDLQWGYDAAVERLGATPAEMEAFHRAIEVTYMADVAFLDGMFGRTLDALRERGLLDTSLIAFTADHGETLYREDTLFKYTHGLQLAPEVLEVPFLVRSPLHGLTPGAYEPVTRSIDVYPTLAGLCGIDLEGRGVQGVDLSAALLGEESPPALLAYSHTTKIGAHMQPDFARWSQTRRFFATDDVDRIWTRVREDDVVHKWRNLGDDRWGTEVFDLAVDPHEARDLFDPEDERQREVTALLRAYKERLVENFRQGDAPEDALERLGDMGYADVEGAGDD